MLRRTQGKLAFGTLQDAEGRIQLFAPSKVTPDFDRFTGLSLGDWIGVTGEVMTTRRGELSIKVQDWTILAEHPKAIPRQVPRHHRPRTAVPAALRRPMGHPRSPPRLRDALQDVEPDETMARGPGYSRGRNAGVPSDSRWCAGPSVHHPPQRARLGVLPPYRTGAVSQAVGRRWASNGSSRSPGSSATRASVPGTTPSSRCSSCTRPTPTTTTSWDSSKS